MEANAGTDWLLLVLALSKQRGSWSPGLRTNWQALCHLLQKHHYPAFPGRWVQGSMFFSRHCRIMQWSGSLKPWWCIFNIDFGKGMPQHHWTAGYFPYVVLNEWGFLCKNWIISMYTLLLTTINTGCWTCIPNKGPALGTLISLEKTNPLILLVLLLVNSLNVVFFWLFLYKGYTSWNKYLHRNIM